MNTLLINASPRSFGSASSYFGGLLRLNLGTNKTTQIKLRGEKDYAEIFNHFHKIEALVIVFPVYVDSVPSHLLRFIKEAEGFCKENNFSFKLYAVTNCGFFEGRQCENALENMRFFANKAGIEWGGGLGIGAGEMLSVLRLTAISSLLTIVIFAIFLAFGKTLGIGDYISFGVSSTVFLLCSAGMIYSISKMAQVIKKKLTTGNFYTTVTCCPRFLFSILANAYMIVRAAINGVPFWRLYEKK